MNAQTERFTIPGPAGLLEVARDSAAGARRGAAVVAHPHPLFGGTLDNKVVQTLARAFVQCGWDAWRFNFRGVGQSVGAYDDGQGERDDLLAVVAHATQGDAPGGPLALAGFSFGAFVTSHAAVALLDRYALEKLVLVGTAASRFAVAAVPEALHERTLVVHGEHDDTVPLAAVMDWARPQLLPVTVVPGGGHFFHGQLPLLKQLVVRHLQS
ncbi:MAG: alpha/beta hydrolase [Pseudomonadota bacterium]